MDLSLANYRHLGAGMVVREIVKVVNQQAVEVGVEVSGNIICGPDNGWHQDALKYQTT